MFWFLLMGLIGLMVLLYVSMGLFIYADARKRSEDAPALWTAIVLLTPNFMGLLVYFLVGRKKKSDGSRNKYKRPLMVTAAGTVIFLFCFIGYMAAFDGVPFIANTSVGMVSNNWGSNWSVSFKTSGETLYKTVDLDEEEMEKVWVESSCEEGNLYLLLIQGKQSEVVDITDFEGYLDLSKYQQGQIKMQFYNEKARNAKFKLNW